MCASCVEAVTATFPEVPDNEVGNFLMSVTAFPMGSPELVAQQLQELRAKTSNYKECYGLVEAEMEEILRNSRTSTEEP